MNAKVRFALALALLTLCVVGLFGLAGLALWTGLDAARRSVFTGLLHESLGLLVSLALLLPFVLGALLRWWVKAWPQALVRIAEEVTLIHSLNPEHRVTPSGAAALRQLGAAINAFAEAQQRLLKQLQSRRAEADASLEEERKRLAALMSELAHGVVVCNGEGRVLLFNPLAVQLLVGAAPESAPARLAGSVFELLERSQIEHALDKIVRRIEQEVAHPVAHFVAPRGDRLLRVQMAPVLDAQGEIGGFVLMLEDITRSIASSTLREQLLRQLTEGTRASLANIRAAVETVQQYPDMDTEQRERFIGVIHDEAQHLSAKLDAAAAQAQAPGLLWPLEDMLADDLVHALQRNVERRLGISLGHRAADEPLWLSVDSHALVNGLTHLLGRIVAAFAIRSVLLESASAGRFLRLTLCWGGMPLEPELLRQWEDQPCASVSGGPGPTLGELLQRHGAEWWSHSDRATGLSRLCIQLPAARPAAPAPA